MENTKVKKIYIVLTHTGTILSRITKVLTQNTYTHASLALDEGLNTLCSFGRLNPYNPFIGGFVYEGISFGTFKRFKNTRTVIYSIEVTNKEYSNLVKNIDSISNDRLKYKFNIIGLLCALFRIRWNRKNKFYCSEFVRYMLEISNIRNKEIQDIMRPEDFKQLKGLQLEYVGLLREYN